jgi:hypothetical protein
MRVVTGLTLGGMLARHCRSLLEESVHTQGSWWACLVEERDHIERFMLFNRDHRLAGIHANSQEIMIKNTYNAEYCGLLIFGSKP